MDASITTLLVGYYYDVLLRDIDADVLTDKMCTTGLLAEHERAIIYSGHSIHHRNMLLLEHVRHMDLQALVTFCELLQEMWPQIALQLTTGMHVHMYIFYSEYKLMFIRQMY